MRAVVFGAGAVGLGFLGELLSDSGWNPLFVDVDEGLVASLDARGVYTLNKTGGGIHALHVGGVAAVHTAGSERLRVALGTADAVFTAAGVQAFPAIAAALREAAGREKPLNVFCCENSPDSAAALRQAVGERAANGLRFVNTVVARMCQRLTQEERDLSPVTPDVDTVLLAESYPLLAVDGSAVVEPRPVLEGMRYLSADEFEAWDARKTFAHNGVHALLAALGRLRGYRYLYQAADDPQVGDIARRCLSDEIGPALVSAYPRWLSVTDQEAYSRDLLARLADRDFADTVERGLRGAMRMVTGTDGRLVRAAQFVAREGITPRGLCLAVAAVFRLNGVPRNQVPEAIGGVGEMPVDEVVETVLDAFDQIGPAQVV